MKGSFFARKKPVVVEVWGPIEVAGDIKTLEGTHHASIGDYIIRGVKGETYPIKPDIFEQTYERVDGTDSLVAELERIARSKYDVALDSERNHRAFAESHLRIQLWLARQETKP